jgi:hypothetical protein
MLLIAQPKSASTSLLYTLKKITGLGIREGIAKKWYEIDCEDFVEIQKHHSNMGERGSLFLKRVITSRKVIYREHLLPTKRHLKILNKLNKKVVILLRNPEDSFDSYIRLKNSNADEEELKRDLIHFFNYYMDFSKDKKKILVVKYGNLVLNYKSTMKKIMKHFRLPIPKKIPSLLKKKYTGVGEKRIRDKRKIGK